MFWHVFTLHLNAHEEALIQKEDMGSLRCLESEQSAGMTGRSKKNRELIGSLNRAVPE